MKCTALAFGIATVLLQTHLAVAQTPPMDHSKMAMPMSADATASTKAYTEAMEKMHKNMPMAMTGDADTDFIRGMLPHHQGAVDMATVALQYGKDPKVKKLARDIIKSQNAEIAWMKTWLAKHSR